MKRTFLTISAIIALGFSSYAQGGNMNLPTAYIRNTLSGTNNLPPDVIGSQYVNEDFKKGQVTIDGKSFETYVRYNAFKDEFEIKEQSGDITSLLRRENMIVKIGQDTYEIFSYIEDGQSQKGYFKKLNSGENILLLKEDVTLTAAQKATSTYSADKPASLDLESQYFLKLNDNAAQEIRLKRKDILKAIDSKKLEEYVSENKFKLKDENEVIQALNYINAS